jgi:hypothetical protein
MATSVWQRVRRRFTTKALFRCATCGLMFWAGERRRHRSEPTSTHPRPNQIEPPNLQALDAELEQARQSRDE